MKISNRLLLTILFCTFLVTIVPATLYLLDVYDKFPGSQDSIIKALIWIGGTVAIGTTMTIVQLSLRSVTTQTSKKKKTNETVGQDADEAERTEETEITDKFSLTETEIKKSFANKTTVTSAGEALLSLLSKKINLVKGALYSEENKIYVFRAGYAFHITEDKNTGFELGEGVVGQAAKSKKAILLNEIPTEQHTVISGLGEGKPKFLLAFPLVHNKKVIAVLELATFNEINPTIVAALEELNKIISAELDKVRKADKEKGGQHD